MSHKMDNDSDFSSSGARGGRADDYFRVKVCMERFFSDERARAFVCVRRGERVRALRRRLRDSFALPPRLALLSQGHLLPPGEPLAVLDRDDTVHVVPSSVDWSVPPVTPESGVGDLDVAPSTREDGHDAPDSAASDPARVATPPPPPASDLDNDEELRERKRRALLQLQQYCDGSSAPRPRRRRVRRRRRRSPSAPHAAPGPADDAAPGPADDAAPGPADDAAPGPADDAAPGPADDAAPGPWYDAAPSPGDGEQARAASVLRNGSERPRQPRVIRPLDGDHL